MVRWPHLARNETTQSSTQGATPETWPKTRPRKETLPLRRETKYTRYTLYYTRGKRQSATVNSIEGVEAGVAAGVAAGTRAEGMG